MQHMDTARVTRHDTPSTPPQALWQDRGRTLERRRGGIVLYGVFVKGNQSHDAQRYRGSEASHQSQDVHEVPRPVRTSSVQATLSRGILYDHQKTKECTRYGGSREGGADQGLWRVDTRWITYPRANTKCEGGLEPALHTSGNRVPRTWS